jgi:hypothetical protein
MAKPNANATTCADIVGYVIIVLGLCFVACRIGYKYGYEAARVEYIGPPQYSVIATMFRCAFYDDRLLHSQQEKALWKCTQAIYEADKTCYALQS